jgi:hypothetical protein
MRTLDAIDAEPRLLGAVRAAPGDSGGQPTMMAVDELLDERLDAAHTPRPSPLS